MPAKSDSACPASTHGLRPAIRAVCHSPKTLARLPASSVALSPRPGRCNCNGAISLTIYMYVFGSAPCRVGLDMNLGLAAWSLWFLLACAFAFAFVTALARTLVLACLRLRLQSLSLLHPIPHQLLQSPLRLYQLRRLHPLPHVRLCLQLQSLELLRFHAISLHAINGSQKPASVAPANCRLAKSGSHECAWKPDTPYSVVRKIRQSQNTGNEMPAQLRFPAVCPAVTFPLLLDFRNHNS